MAGTLAMLPASESRSKNAKSVTTKPPVRSPFFMKPKTRYFTRLSGVQIKLLCVMAGQAFKAAKSRGAVEDGQSADEFRKAGQMEAAGVESLKLATQEHFLAIRGKWWVIIGNLELAFYDFLNSGAENEALRQMQWRLMGQLSLLAAAMAKRDHSKALNELISAGATGALNAPMMAEDEAARQAWAYGQSLSRDKFERRGIDSLDADELEELGFTVVNRANAMHGVGDKTTRNKSQRRKPAKAPFEPEEVNPCERGKNRSAPVEGMTLVGSAAARLAPSWGRA